jgi:hypothetical protein
VVIPDQPKIYHIVHVDRLPSIIADGFLWSDAEAVRRNLTGTIIGMNSIKSRRLTELMLDSHPDLHVGSCVPFYFCPRSVMLYLISCANHPDLAYRGGQGPIMHLELDLQKVVEWVDRKALRWAFTLSNAGSRYFKDYSDLARLNEIDWDAVNARDWKVCRESKQAEFLAERQVPWELVERIGVHSVRVSGLVSAATHETEHRPPVSVLPDWYY